MNTSGLDSISGPEDSILAGIETEYGFTIEGRGPHEQVDDATEFVKLHGFPCFLGWDYRFESPRADLRGFNLERLAVDPVDAQFDAGRPSAPPHEVRADQVLTNGARFYNDHGHPEYATPECFSLRELVVHDKAGEMVLLKAGRALEAKLGKPVQVYKNNTDFHGSSYGTHESYLVPREVGFEPLRDAVMPILIARQVLTGAGKAGSETGQPVPFQLSARADFFVEPVNAETLFKRPVFNTRDEAHADPARWIRLHVISGDANMIPTSTFLKVGLVKLAVMLAKKGHAPNWKIEDPVRAFQSVSRDASLEFKIRLAGQSWTDAYQIFDDLFARAEAHLVLDEELRDVIATSRMLINDLQGGQELARQRIDWLAKRSLLAMIVEDQNLSWSDPSLRSYDLDYHHIDPDISLYSALAEASEVEGPPATVEMVKRLTDVPERTRAFVRGLAVEKFGRSIHSVCWRSITFALGGQLVELDLPPDRLYPENLAAISDVEAFVSAVKLCL